MLLYDAYWRRWHGDYCSAYSELEFVLFNDDFFPNVWLYIWSGKKCRELYRKINNYPEYEEGGSYSYDYIPEKNSKYWSGALGFEEGFQYKNYRNDKKNNYWIKN